MTSKTEGSDIYNKVEYLTISEDSSEQRLDNFLMSRLKPLTRSQTYQMIRTGQVRVNKSRAKPMQKLKIGDVVRVPPFFSKEKQEVKPSQTLLQKLEASILHEDRDLLVMNKPAGMAVHGGSGVSLGMIEAIRQLRPQAKFLELAHRLDKETSGVLIVAKSRKMLLYLHQLLRDGGLKKIYLTLVQGCWKGPKQVVMPLKKNQLQSGERFVKVSLEDGKESVTNFKILNYIAEHNVSLLEASPLTGRTHQIRVHSAYMGHPIVGDEKYGDRKENQRMAKCGFKHLYLHAYAIEIPIDDGFLKIVCEPPNYWSGCYSNEGK